LEGSAASEIDGVLRALLHGLIDPGQRILDGGAQEAIVVI